MCEFRTRNVCVMDECGRKGFTLPIEVGGYDPYLPCLFPVPGLDGADVRNPRIVPSTIRAAIAIQSSSLLANDFNCMEANFALDIRVARERSGLSQSQVAHLLGINRTRLSSLECGRRTPTAEEIATLSLIYGKRLRQLGVASMPAIYEKLAQRLDTLPNRENYANGSGEKADTLNHLSDTLEDSPPAYDG